MPLPTPSLDDRTFQDLVDEAKRLIPLYCPEWTNHNVSDPGVALIELFAWMSEQVLYRLNQVPERLYRHFLNMVGVEPFAGSAARADLTFWLSADMTSDVVVQAGTEVTTAASTSGHEDAIVFTTVDDLRISPPQLRAAVTRSADGVVANVSDDLLKGHGPIACFTSVPPRPADALLLGFAESLAGMIVRIDVAARAEGVGITPDAPPVTWSVSDGDDWTPCTVYQDTTGGFNRDGSISLIVPRTHAARSMEQVDHPMFWLRAELIEVVSGAATYGRSPSIGSMRAVALGGTAQGAENSLLVEGETLGRSDGTPGQVFRTARTPVLPRREDECVTVVQDGTAVVWTEVEDFSASRPDSLHYMWDDSSGAVAFGPRVRYPDRHTYPEGFQQHGRIPRDGALVVVTRYRSGGGSRANVGKNKLTLLRSSVPFVDGVTNREAATGGVDAETVPEAMVRAPLTLRTGQRAVTAGDFVRLTKEASPQVARVHCESAQLGDGSVRVLVVPTVHKPATQHVLDDFVLSEDLNRSIEQKLDRHRLVGTGLEIQTPYYQGVSVVTLIAARGTDNARDTRVQERVRFALDTYINPLTGGPDRTGWPFERDLNVAAVIQLLESVEGVLAVEEALLFEYDLRNGQRLGAAKDVIRLQPRSLFLSAKHRVVISQVGRR